MERKKARKRQRTNTHSILLRPLIRNSNYERLNWVPLGPIFCEPFRIFFYFLHQSSPLTLIFDFHFIFEFSFTFSRPFTTPFSPARLLTSLLYKHGSFFPGQLSVSLSLSFFWVIILGRTNFSCYGRNCERTKFCCRFVSDCVELDFKFCSIFFLFFCFFVAVFYFIMNAGRSTSRLLRYPLRSASKIKEEKPPVADASNGSSSKAR